MQSRDNEHNMESEEQKSSQEEYFFNETQDSNREGGSEDERYSVKHVVILVVTILLVVSALTLLAIINLIPERSDDVVLPVPYSVVEMPGSFSLSRASTELSAQSQGHGISILSSSDFGKVASSRDFFRSIGSAEPSSFQSHSLFFSLGFFRSQNSAFPFLLIVSSNSQEDLVDSMRGWEGGISSSLSGFLNTQAGTVFETRHINNSFVRANGLVYGFLENNTVVITSTVGQFEDLLNYYREVIAQ